MLMEIVCVSGVELVSCDLLREGAPIEPIPPVSHWKPEAVVSAPAHQSRDLSTNNEAASTFEIKRQPTSTSFTYYLHDACSNLCRGFGREPIIRQHSVAREPMAVLIGGA